MTELPPATLRPMYLDCNGSTPTEPELLLRFGSYLSDPAYWGNISAGHARHGRAALDKARRQLAAWANGIPCSEPDAQVGGNQTGCAAEGVFFCASATEANNMAILGLRQVGERNGRKHIIASELEHVSVRKACEHLVEYYGFELTVLAPGSDGRVETKELLRQLRTETLLICCMQVSNETGVVQPIAELAEALAQEGHPAWLYVDATQGAAHLGSDGAGLHPEAALSHPRIDMLCISGHKMYGICGIAALLLKRRCTHPKQPPEFPPLQALLCGGAQQGLRILKGLRSGSVPLALALNLRDALLLCESARMARRARNLEFRRHFEELLRPLCPRLHGDQSYILPHVLNVSLPGIDAESTLLNLRSLLSAGRGAACSTDKLVNEPDALRFSWWHGSPRFWDSGVEGENWQAELRRRLLRLKS